MFSQLNIEDDFHKRVEGDDALRIEIIFGFEAQFVDAGF